MTVNVNWANPYENREGSWLKGNLHIHTTPNSGCAVIPARDCIDLYVEKGYDFIAISDHGKYASYEDARITFLTGIEWNDDNGANHMGIYFVSEDDFNLAVSIRDHALLRTKMADAGALVVLNHPDWQLRSHYRREELEERSGYDGIEIYNAVIERAPGYAISTDKWDYLLTKGRRVLGFANDDSHAAQDIGRSAIHVRSASNKPDDIIAGIRAGNFYASSGAIIDDIRMDNGVIELETPDGQEIWASKECGIVFQRAKDRSICVDTRGLDAPYVRFTVFAQGSDMAWTQPFFLEKKG